MSQARVGLSDGKLRYLALPASTTTEVQVVDRDARVLRHMRVKGIWGIPLVAYDGTAEGLFPNGRTLLLAQSLDTGQTLRTTTKFTLVDTRRMKVIRRIQLKGAFAMLFAGAGREHDDGGVTVARHAA